jgi:hypothetical protein
MLLYKTIGRELKKNVDADFDYYYDKYFKISNYYGMPLKMKKENKYIIFYHELTHLFSENEKTQDQI